MSRVVLLCPEPMARGSRAGIGIRFVEIARVLRGDGHEVTVLSPDGGELEGCRAAASSPETIAGATETADVAVVQGHIANELFAHGRPIPTVVDLYDPFIVENLHYYESRGPEVFKHDHDTLIRSLSRGDLFLCASQTQRFFYLGLLTALGRLNPVLFERDPDARSLIAIAPFGVQPRREQRAPVDLEKPEVLFGGIYDWYDPILAIEAVRKARLRLPQLSLTFNTHPNADLTPQSAAARAIAHVRKHGLGDFIRFEPWVAYEDRAAFFDRFAAALMTFPRSLETDLAMRTRVYDYMWAGIPIVTTSAPGTDEVLRQYGAGIVVDTSDAEALAEALTGVLEDRSRRESMVAASRRFVDEHQWQQTLAPLRDFCRNPRVDPDRDRFTAALHVPAVQPTLAQRIRRRLGALA